MNSKGVYSTSNFWSILLVARWTRINNVLSLSQPRNTYCDRTERRIHNYSIIIQCLRGILNTMKLIFLLVLPTKWGQSLVNEVISRYRSQLGTKCVTLPRATFTYFMESSFILYLLTNTNYSIFYIYWTFFNFSTAPLAPFSHLI